MTFIIMMAKAILLIALAVVAFGTLAIFLGFEPEVSRDVASCRTDPSPICLFTIL